MTDIKRIETGVDDDVFAAITADADKPTPSVLAGLREELARKIANEPLVLVIPGRPNVRATFDTNLDATIVQQWRRKARNKAMEDDLDTVKFSVIVIANTMTALEYHDGSTWTEVVNDDGDPLTFRHDLTEWLLPTTRPGETRTVTDGVRHLFGGDAAMFRAVDAIFTAAGYDRNADEDVVEDPSVIW